MESAVSHWHSFCYHDSPARTSPLVGSQDETGDELGHQQSERASTGLCCFGLFTLHRLCHHADCWHTAYESGFPFFSHFVRRIFPHNTPMEIIWSYVNYQCDCTFFYVLV